MPFIMKAVVAALKEYPEMNAVIDDENEEIVYRDYYNIGVATATDVGLMVPVVEDADRKENLQLSSQMNELVQKARERSISPMNSGVDVHDHERRRHRRRVRDADPELP